LGSRGGRANNSFGMVISFDHQPTMYSYLH
jgi:hypothetical protein